MNHLHDPRHQPRGEHSYVIVISTWSPSTSSASSASPAPTHHPREQPPPVTPRQKIAKTHRPCQASFRSLPLALKFHVFGGPNVIQASSMLMPCHIPHASKPPPFHVPELVMETPGGDCMVRTLAAAKAQVDKTTTRGHTALHYAAWGGADVVTVCSFLRRTPYEGHAAGRCRDLLRFVSGKRMQADDE